MSKTKMMLPIAALSVTLGLAAPAVAAVTKPPVHHVTDFEAVAGIFKTKAAATKTLADLTAKGHKGFKVELDGRRGVEVEKQFKTMNEAKTEQAALVKDGFKAATVERS